LAKLRPTKYIHFTKSLKNKCIPRDQSNLHIYFTNTRMNYEYKLLSYTGMTYNSATVKRAGI